nr:MAG TPA: nucelotide kinase [Bacteriophage sp.]
MSNERITINYNIVNAYINEFKNFFCIEVEVFGDIYKNPLMKIDAKANEKDIYETFMVHLQDPKLRDSLDYNFINIAYKFAVPYDEFRNSLYKVYSVTGDILSTIQIEDKETTDNNKNINDINDIKNSINKLWDLYHELFSITVCYGALKNNTSVNIYINNWRHSATEVSMRYAGDLKSPAIVANILLFLHENYSKLGVAKKDFDAKYIKFLDWYLKKEETQMKSTRVDYISYVEEQEKMAKSQENDIINHPEHYTKGGIEVRDFIDSWHLDFNSGNVIKYVVRAPYKGTELQDLKKAQNYLNHLIELKEKEEAEKC